MDFKIFSPHRTQRRLCRKKEKSIFFLCALLLISTKGMAMPGYHEPWGKDADLIPAKEIPAVQSKPSMMVKLARQAILFHQNVLTKVDGPRSHYRPSSSQYMLLAMQKHGFIKGYFLGCDRLLRENDADWVYLKIEEGGKLIKYDPPP
jgi:putative component of membrane protein insertase Oxa1/YidC/SpoIIIJ protein YidD